MKNSNPSRSRVALASPIAKDQAVFLAWCAAGLPPHERSPEQNGVRRAFDENQGRDEWLIVLPLVRAIIGALWVARLYGDERLLAIPSEWLHGPLIGASDEFAAGAARIRQIVDTACLGPDDVAEMLETAKGPQAHSRAGLVRLSADCLRLSVEHNCQLPLMNWSRAKKRRQNVSALMRQVATIADEDEFIYGDRRIAQTLRRFSKKLEGLPLSQPNFGPNERRRWARGAHVLAQTYTETVNPQTGWWRGGPAVGFLLRALSRIYPDQRPTESAIEIELYR